MSKMIGSECATLGEKMEHMGLTNPDRPTTDGFVAGYNFRHDEVETLKNRLRIAEARVEGLREALEYGAGVCYDEGLVKCAKRLRKAIEGRHR